MKRWDNVEPITDAEYARVMELLEWFDRLGAKTSLSPSARCHQSTGYGRADYDARLLARDIRREHYQTDDDWLTEPLVNEGIR